LISHGEIKPQQYDFGYSNSEMAEAGGSSHTNYANNECYVDHMEYMIDDAVLANQNVRVQEESSCQELFYDVVQAAQQFLYNSCSIHSKLCAAVRLLSIKSDYNMPQNCFNEVVQLIKEMYPPNNRVSHNYG